MTADNIAVRAESLTKVYQLYDRPIDRLKESLSPFRKKYHRDFYALRDVSFEIGRGDTFGIIGRNGSGKSTLLKIIAGVLTPTGGAVGVSGRVSAILELGVGLNPEMSGVDNIYLNGTIAGNSREETARMLPGILSFADIGEFAYQPVRNYSSGMLVRLAFAMAVSVSPDVLIVDEALAVGDVAFQQKCLNELERMIRGGMTLLFVSHDMQMVRNYCQSAIYLRGGEIRYNGSAEMATEAYLKDMWDEQNYGGSQGRVVAWRPVDDNPAAVAYGTQAGRITAVDLSAGEGGMVHQGDRVTLSIGARVADEVINPKIIWQLRDQRGYTIYGIETLSQGISYPRSERKDGRIGAEFSFEARLAPGHYFVSAGLTDHISQTANLLLDKQVGVLHIEVLRRGRSFAGVCDLQSTCRRLEE